MAYVEVEAGRRIKIVSWSAVIAGAVTVLAISLLLSLLASGMGLDQVDADATNPLSGVGATFGWSSAVFLLLSLAAGGYVAGYLSGVAGWIHGFLTWALAMLVAAWLSVAALGGVINMTGTVLGGVASATTSAAGAATSAVGGAADLVGNAVSSLSTTLDEQVFDEIDADVTGQLSAAVEQADLSALEPQVIEDQLAGARTDVTQAAQSLIADPTSYDAVLETLLADLRARVETLNSEINREDIVAAIAANTTLTDEQVEQAADRAMELYTDLATQARGQIETLDETVTAAQERLVALQERAIQQAERTANAASSAAYWAFFGALIGGVVAIAAGIMGTRSPVASRTRY